MTEAAKGVTYEAYVEAKWTDAQMVQAGVLVITEVEEAAPAWSNNTPTQAAAAPAPAVQAEAQVAPVTAGIKPPWEQ
jgi:hypothetical protein